MEAGELKKLVARSRATGRGSYPKEVREAVIAYARGRHAQHVSREKVAAELGMSVATLGYWCSPPRRKAKLTPVAIVPARLPEREVVVECGPLRVRGLDVGGVAELLRRLG